MSAHRRAIVRHSAPSRRAPFQTPILASPRDSARRSGNSWPTCDNATGRICFRLRFPQYPKSAMPLPISGDGARRPRPPIVDVVPLGGGLPRLGLLGPLRPGRSAFTKGYAGTWRSALGTRGAAVLLSGRRPLSLPCANSERPRIIRGTAAGIAGPPRRREAQRPFFFRRGRSRTGSYRGAGRRGGARGRHPGATKRPEWPEHRGR